MKKFFKFFLVIIIIFFSLIISGFLWFNRSTGNIPENGVEFQIKKGDSSHSIAKRLYVEGYINSREFYLLITRILKLDNKLKAGWVKLQPGFKTMNIIYEIYRGNFISVNFTIPEGSNINQIKEILINEEIVSRNEIENFFSTPGYTSLIGLDGFESAEGFLFPDTYKFYKGVSTQVILSKMVDHFFEKLSEMYPDYKNLKKNDLLKKVILASIIEKEVKNSEESSIVAGVFNNRLKTGMRLQSCATVQYILKTPKEHLLESDLKINHPYNTYLYKGLPPGPISNPGLNALNAAFYPAKHDYLFFVVKDPEKGTHYFSKSYNEHIIARSRYKKIKGYD